MPPIGRKREKTMLQCKKVRRNEGLARLSELQPARFRGLIAAYCGRMADRRGRIMRASDHLSDFVREALLRGREPAAIQAALAEAGWSENETRDAMAGWLCAPDLPPIPRPRPYVSAREALLYGLLFLSLGAIAWHVGSMGFDLIDRLLPLSGVTPGYGSDSGMRWSAAALLTFGPLFYFLNARAAKATRGDPGLRRSLVRKWFASVTLLVAALVLLGDLVLAIYTMLEGSLSVNYLSKALLVAALGVLVSLYYRDEIDA